MNDFNRAIIVGCGSVGKRHARFLKSRCSELIIVDPESTTSKEFEPAQYFASLEQINFELSSKDVLVVSNWGPDHFKTIQFAITIGAKQIVLEKPCVDSLSEIELLERLCTENSIKIAVNHGSFYTDLGNRINKLSSKFNLGEIVAIWVSGGARCLSTAGSHWISLANQIFLSNPTQIFGDGINHKINPRSESLAFYEGVFSFIYPTGKRLAISLTNLSSIEGTFQIYWENATAVLDQENIVIKSRDLINLPEKITRYDKENILIYNGMVPTFNQNINESFLDIYQSFKKYNFLETNANFKKHLDVTKTVLLAIISSEQKKQINFNQKIDLNYYYKKYLIS